MTEVISQRVPRDFAEIMDGALENLASLSHEPGQWIHADENLVFACLASSESQMEYVLEALRAQLWIELESGVSMVRLLPSGWAHVSELRRRPVRGRQVFIAMSFADELDPVWRDGIARGVESAGLVARRVDKAEHNEKICDVIIAEIRRSRAVVADFTQQRHGVYFEAGYALGMGIPVIWMCRRDDLANCHFDTRQYNHIVWDTAEDIRQRLEKRLMATVLEPHEVAGTAPTT